MNLIDQSRQIKGYRGSNWEDRKGVPQGRLLGSLHLFAYIQNFGECFIFG